MLQQTAPEELRGSPFPLDKITSDERNDNATSAIVSKEVSLHKDPRTTISKKGYKDIDAVFRNSRTHDFDAEPDNNCDAHRIVRNQRTHDEDVRNRHTHDEPKNVWNPRTIVSQPGC